MRSLMHTCIRVQYAVRLAPVVTLVFALAVALASSGHAQPDLGKWY